ncbi:MAG: hypothetical protein EIB84_05290 [Spiroplasma poulsonii]|uniref:hypothetical protein n=1 Tax=Spiroplasma poulsonii TaxID=2138 RepID=UPI000AD3DD6B|nr:hypothetical protein [Spiroplasma poulsonii]MBW1242209.1 hypothetical protein [Spiroplasma poulsonii]
MDNTTEIIPKIQGMIYLTNYSTNKDVEVESITGPAIYQVPTFKIGKTDQKTFLNNVATTKSPFVEFISNHFFNNANISNC